MTFRFTLNTLIICIIYIVGKTTCYTIPKLGMACETEAPVEAVVCERKDTCAGFGDPTGVITVTVPLDGIVFVSLCVFCGLVTISDALVTLDVAVV